MPTDFQGSIHWPILACFGHSLDHYILEILPYLYPALLGRNTSGPTYSVGCSTGTVSTIDADRLCFGATVCAGVSAANTGFDTCSGAIACSHFSGTRSSSCSSVASGSESAAYFSNCFGLAALPSAN